MTRLRNYLQNNQWLVSINYPFHSTMIAGESKNPGRNELMKLASHFRLKNAGNIIEEVQEAIHQWGAIATLQGISKETKNTIQSAIDRIS